MANAREIQNRMKSIQDTLKITNAMYMISSTKLQKAKKSLAQTENYFFTLQNMISRILRRLTRLFRRIVCHIVSILILNKSCIFRSTNLDLVCISILDINGIQILPGSILDSDF